MRVLQCPWSVLHKFVALFESRGHDARAHSCDKPEAALKAFWNAIIPRLAAMPRGGVQTPHGLRQGEAMLNKGKVA